MTATQPLVFTEDDVRNAVTMEMAIEAARTAFALTLSGGLAAPMPWHLDMTEGGGAVHVKGAAVADQPTFAVKVSTGFPGNAQHGLPTSSGFSAVFDTTTGQLRAMLLDNGYLTELRTGAAGALATDLLAPKDIDTATIIGTGGQTRHQLFGLLTVRQPRQIILCGRNAERVADLADWMRSQCDIDIRETTDAHAAVQDADVIITVTNATSPLFDADALTDTVHITAVGSDTPGKRELPPALIRIASLVAADSIDQSFRLGELQGIDPESLAHLTTMGHLVTQPTPRPDGRTVADLSGLGLQDATIADTALRALTTSPSGLRGRARY